MKNEIPEDCLDDDTLKEHVVKETKESFSHKVEEIVWMKDITYLEAIKEQTELSDLEPQTVSKLITKDLYAKLEEEAEELFLIKPQNKNRLNV